MYSIEFDICSSAPLLDGPCRLFSSIELSKTVQLNLFREIIRKVPARQTPKSAKEITILTAFGQAEVP